MADVINLNKKRKAKKRILKQKQSTKNRLKFGISKEERLTLKKDSDRNERHLEGHKLEKDEPNPE